MNLTEAHEPVGHALILFWMREAEEYHHGILAAAEQDSFSRPEVAPQQPVLYLTLALRDVRAAPY